MKHSFKFVTNKIYGLVFFAIFPLLVSVIGLGGYLIIQENKLDWFVYATCASTLLLVVGRLAWLLYTKNMNTQEVSTALTAEELETYSVPSPYWSSAEIQLWEAQLLDIQQIIKVNSDLGQTKNQIEQVLTNVAGYYNKSLFDFNAIEALSVIEEIAKRFRETAHEHMPMIENIQFSYLKNGYEVYRNHAQTIQTGMKLAGYAKKALGVAVNPVRGVFSLASETIIAPLKDELKDNALKTAKAILLQEVLHVAIDLYSGRLNLVHKDNLTTTTSKDDNNHIAKPLEPIRIVLAGQTSSGKSSIVNSMLQDIVAEVDSLPSTATKQIYSATVEDIEIKLVDMVGMDGNAETTKAMLDEITQGDLVIWVLKANQSARKLDSDLKKAIEHFYTLDDNISKKQPKLLGVLNQIDLLPDEHHQEAINYNQNLLQLDHITACSTLERDGMIPVLEMLNSYIDEAKNTQLNRAARDSINAQAKSDTVRFFKSAGFLGEKYFKQVVQ